MPIFRPNFIIRNCWSSVGNISFFHIDGICYWKSKPCPAFPGTPSQLVQMSLHRRALEAWRSLGPETHRLWNTYASSVPSHRPPFGTGSHISGYNLFVSAYHGFAQLGNEHVPEPEPFPLFPVAVVESADAMLCGVSTLQLDCRVKFSTAVPPDRFRLAARIQLARPGAGRNQSLMRSFLADTVWVRRVESEMFIMLVRFIIPDYREIWDLDLPSYQLHMQYRLLDSVTGYRDRHANGKFVVGRMSTNLTYQSGSENKRKYHRELTT